MSRRALLTFTAGSAAALLSGCGEEVHDVEGVIVGKYGHGEAQANTASDWTFLVEIANGNVVYVPVSEYEYGRHDVGEHIHATGTDGNIWMVNPL